jgi:hypothetical protein
MGREPGQRIRLGFGKADDPAIHQVFQCRHQVVSDGLVVLDEERDEGHALVSL